MCTSVHCSIIYNSQDMETTPNCPLADKCIKKMWYTHILQPYKEQNLAICNNMNGL